MKLNKKVLTYKVYVCVVDWGLLQANVKDYEDGMCQIAGKTKVGKRNPEPQGQEVFDQTWREQEIKKKGSIVFKCLTRSFIWDFICMMQRHISPKSKIHVFLFL